MTNILFTAQFIFVSLWYGRNTPTQDTFLGKNGKRSFHIYLMLTLYHFRTTSPESRKLVKWNAEDALAFLRKSERGNPTFDDYIVSCRTICLLIIKHQQRRQFLTTYGNLSF